MRLLIPILILFIFFATGCIKNDLEKNCQKLKTAMANGNVDQAGEAINNFINHLSDQTYTNQNLDQLVRDIEGECDMDAQVLCFDCIMTLPSQSEFRISFQSGNNTVNKVIDMSYNPNNRMKFLNMHD